MKRKVCVVITARPSYSRIRTALAAIAAHPELELQLVVTASALLDRYGGADKVIENEGFRIDRRVFLELLSQFPQIAIAVMRELAHRLEMTNQQLARMRTG